MSNAQHTPGPWEVSIPFSTASRHPAHIVSGRRFIAAMYHGSIYEQRRETHPNALLIAAAPELLEALQRLSAQCTRLRLPGQPETDAEKTARAVIAKATGGAE